MLQVRRPSIRSGQISVWLGLILTSGFLVVTAALRHVGSASSVGCSQVAQGSISEGRTFTAYADRQSYRAETAIRGTARVAIAAAPSRLGGQQLRWSTETADG